MKSFIAVLALVAVAAADVAHLRQGSGADRDAQVLRQESDVRPDGFTYALETSNGIASQASGQLRQVGEEAAIVVQGSDQFSGPDGQTYQITYTADENGYQPQGAHLPTPPPTQAIPEYILRSIRYNEEHPSRESSGPAARPQFNRFK